MNYYDKKSGTKWFSQQLRQKTKIVKNLIKQCIAKTYHVYQD